MHVPPDPSDPHPPRASRRTRLAWLPIPALGALIAALWVADLQVAWTLPVLNWLIHYGSAAIAIGLIVIPGVRNFLATGQSGILMLSCGVLMSEIGVLAMPTGTARSTSTGFAIYNTSALLSALCHLAGVTVVVRRRSRLPDAAAWTTAALAGSFGAMGLIVWLALTGRTPVFFVDGQGGTLVRSLVVSTAAALFLLTAGLLWRTNRRAPSRFLYWYALGLALLGVGLTGSALIAVWDSPLQWVTRSTQFLGVVYMCVAVATSVRRDGAAPVPLAAVEDAWRENAFLAGLQQQTPLGWALRYGLAAVLVASGMVLRVALTAWVGSGLPSYITFYPAVMGAAVLAGFGPGVLATALAAITTAVWIIPPVGQFAIESPVDRLGLVIFVGMGLSMAVMAELYRRNRATAAAYEREAVLRESREALRRQAELIDPVRADIIAREMQRVVRERGAAVPAAARTTGEALRRVPAVAGLAAAVVGLLALAGWTFGLEHFKTVLSGLANMKANTALCILLAGVALALRDRRVVRTTCAGAVCAVAGLTLAEYVAGRDFGIDQLLFADVLDAHTIFPGRMVEATALGLLSIGVSLLLLDARGRVGRWAQQALAVGAAVIGMVAVLGYAYDVQSFYRFAGASSMALHTAAALLVLAVGLICARADGFVADFAAERVGGRIARRLLAAAILLPAIAGWLRVHGSQAGLFEPDAGAGLYAIVMMLAFAGVVWWTARVLTRADAERRETDAQLRNLAEVMDNAHEPLIVREPGGVILAWNRGAAALYGWSAAEALGRAQQTLLRAEGHSVEERDRQLATTGRWEGELLHTTRDGRRVTVESRQTASRIGDGQVFILESNRDVTERKQAEAALRLSEERLRVTLASIGDAVMTVDTEGRIGFLNPEAVALTGWELQDAVGQPVDRIFRIINELTEQPADDIVRPVLRDARVITLANHTALVTRSGRRIPIEDSAAPILDAAGHVSGVVLVFHDVTEKRRAQEALRRSEERWNAAIENFGEGAIIATEAEQVIYWNPAARAMHGFTSDREGIGPLEETPNTFQLWTPDGSRLLALDEWPMRRIKRGETVDHLELRLRRPEQGWERVVSYSGAMVETASGERLIFLSVYDLTELRKAELTLREADRRKDEFLATLSHELRNPLAPIRYALPVIQQEPLGGTAGRAVAIIGRQVDHLTRLVDDLLDMSRLTSGKIELRRARITLASVVKAAVESVSPAVRAAGHGLNVGMPDDSIWIDADAARVVQVVTNLLDNAARYTPRGGEIWVEAAREDGQAVIRVCDNGIGIPPESLDDVFVMFRRLARPGSSQGGLGIGLALARQLVEMHGGSIEARSAGADRGAEFVVRLPVTDTDGEVPGSDGNRQAPAHATRLKVLVVDDNADLVEMLALAVEGLGHEVRKAHDGRGAISVALSYKPDVVLLDLGLPEVSGIDVARELRRHPEMANVRLVALTGWGQAEDWRQTSEAGFDRHLTKPTDPQELERLLAAYASERVRPN